MWSEEYQVANLIFENGSSCRIVIIFLRRGKGMRRVRFYQDVAPSVSVSDSER